jgi:chromosome segregation protein
LQLNGLTEAASLPLAPNLLNLLPKSADSPLLSPDQLKRRLDQLRGQIRALGAVNPNAIAEYEEALSRYTFLTTQADDLQQAVKSLRTVIAELDDIMRRRFEETFQAVAAEFKRYFTTLFAGGTARLVLTDPDDPQATGVEIIAQPPGKRLQSLALLSGGERALTAVALLFALLSVSPTPFCLLDEVDAALDEANIGRFCEVLQSLTQHTQFIVITHNRGTMEIADALYGVSMGEDSVSRVLSLKLE